MMTARHAVMIVIIGVIIAFAVWRMMTDDLHPSTSTACGYQYVVVYVCTNTYICALGIWD
jgi:hypothetical protein